MNFNSLIRKRKEEPQKEEEFPRDIILEDFQGNIVAYLMRNTRCNAYQIIPQFKTINDITVEVGTYYEGFMVVEKEFRLVTKAKAEETEG